MPLDFTFWIHHMTLLVKFLVLIGMKSNDVIIWITFPYFWTPCLINSQTFKIISRVESFLCPYKQRTPEESWRIQQSKRIPADDDKDVEISPKNHNQNNCILILIFFSYFYCYIFLFIVEESFFLLLLLTCYKKGYFSIEYFYKIISFKYNCF